MMMMVMVVVVTMAMVLITLLFRHSYIFYTFDTPSSQKSVFLGAVVDLRVVFGKHTHFP